MMSDSRSPSPTPSSNFTANSIAAMRRKYAESSGGRAPGFICAAMPETLRDRRERRPEDVAVVQLRLPAGARMASRSSVLTIV